MRQMDFRAELAKLTPRLRDGHPGKIYVFGVGQQWRGIHQWYLNVVNVDLADYLFAFIDNDTAKQGTTHMGHPVIAPSEIDLDNAVVLITSGMYADEIEKSLISMGLVGCSSYFFPWHFNSILMRFVYGETAGFANSVQGGRCFVIGNGPSLRAEDLDKLHKNNEVCFGVNQIIKIFDKTAWRPNYFFLTNPLSLNQIDFDQIKCPRFTHIGAAVNRFFDKNTYYFDGDSSHFNYPFPFPLKFSCNIERPYIGGTIIYIVIQAGVSMGFDEIYLLGLDHRFPLEILHDGTIVKRDVPFHFYPKNCNDNSSLRSVGSSELMLLSYACAREYCDSHGVKIRNATRGGALEVFQRVDFDSLF